MKKFRFAGTQITFAVRQAGCGTAVANLMLKKHMIVEAFRETG